MRSSSHNVMLVSLKAQRTISEHCCSYLNIYCNFDIEYTQEITIKYTNISLILTVSECHNTNIHCRKFTYLIKPLLTSFLCLFNRNYCYAPLRITEREVKQTRTISTSEKVYLLTWLSCAHFQ